MFEKLKNICYNIYVRLRKGDKDMREIFNSRDLDMSAGLMASMLGDIPFTDSRIDEDYVEYEDLIVDAMDYEVRSR